MPKKLKRRKYSRPKSSIKSFHKSSRAPRKGITSTRSVLILECDSTKLKDQNIVIAQRLYDLLRLLPSRIPVQLVRACSENKLKNDLAILSDSVQHFDIIVVIGHSNLNGIQFMEGPSGFTNWHVFSNWLTYYSPHRLVFIGCEAGRWLASSVLFGSIPSLQEIYGSPILVNQTQANIVFLLIPYLLYGKFLNADLFHIGQFGNFVLTGGIFFRQTRVEFEDTGSQEAVIWTGLETALKQVAPRIHALLKRYVLAPNV